MAHLLRADDSAVSRCSGRPHAQVGSFTTNESAREARAWLARRLWWDRRVAELRAENERVGPMAG